MLKRTVIWCIKNNFQREGNLERESHPLPPPKKTKKKPKNHKQPKKKNTNQKEQKNPPRAK